MIESASIFTSFWHDQITEHHREGIFLVLLSFLASFAFIRTSARLTRSVSWWPGGVQTDSGVHLHHLVWGICLVLIAGTLGYTFRTESPWWEMTAVVFGIGAGLTLDEFALWVYLEDVYWADEGRKSIDAVAVATVFAGLLLLGVRPTDFEAGLSISLITSLAVILLLSSVCFAKQRITYGLVGLFFPVVSLAGAVRLAKPSAPWAKWFYAERNPGKQERSHQRFDVGGRRADRVRRRLFDLIGGATTDELDDRQEAVDEAAAAAQHEAMDHVKRRADQQTTGKSG